MSKQDQINRGSAMNAIAAGQTLLGQAMVIGQGMQRLHEVSEAAYSIQGIPVYHTAKNIFNIEPKKPLPGYKKWGEFTHPYMMIGMPSVPGKIKLYTVLVNNEYYLLLTSTKLDPDYCGPSQATLDITCWTPKQKNDTREKAAERMFHAFLMYTLDLNTETDTFDNDESLEDAWEPSEKCLPLMSKLFTMK
jgi:hypothetical protein